MRWTRSLINTLREEPQEAEIASHKLMLRAGLIRRLGGGLYTFLPLGLRALRKVERIIREEMNRAGALEILMPALQPAELWEQSGRLETMGPGMFRLRDRGDRTMVLGPTHEEVVTDLAAREINSYRQLPCTLYQIQTKFRDEIRPRFGLMRAKEFIMKDAYSFDVSLDAADVSYQAMYDAYVRIFARCGLKTRPVEADTGDIGGNWSHEFMVMAEAGEDAIILCDSCAYAANQERAERRPAESAPAPSAPTPPLEEVATPDTRTIEAVAAFLGCPASQLVKTIICVVDGKPVAVLVDGDRELNLPKLRRALGARSVELADDEVIVKATGAPVGFAGPAGLTIPVYADQALRGATDRVSGANRADTHVRHLDLERDAKIAAYHDLVVVDAGDGCPRCRGTLGVKRGIEVGHVFKLGTKYTQAFGARFLSEQGGAAETMVMGCYGIGVTRTLQAVIEQSRDDDGIIWPVSVAPYVVALLLLDPRDAAVCETVRQLEAELEARGLDVLVDDRDERPGVKFKDADIIGAPFRVVAGSKALARGCVEIRSRGARASELVPVGEAVEWLEQHYREALQALNG
jgi:prolyl-tRNA synthetase